MQLRFAEGAPRLHDQRDPARHRTGQAQLAFQIRQVKGGRFKTHTAKRLIFNPAGQRHRFLAVPESKGRDVDSPGFHRYLHWLGRVPGAVFITKLDGVKYRVPHGIA